MQIIHANHFSGPRQLRAGEGFLDPQEFRDLPVAVSFDHVQVEDDPKVFRQLVQQPEDIFRLQVFVPCREVESLVHVQLITRERQPAILPEVLEATIDGDPGHPGDQGSCLVKPVDIPEHLDKGFLDRILGLLPIAQVPEAQAHQLIGIAIEECAIRTLPATPAPVDDLLRCQSGIVGRNRQKSRYTWKSQVTGR